MTQRVVVLASPVAIIVLAGVLVVQGAAFLEHGWFQRTPVLDLPKAWVYAAMPVGGALMILYAVRWLWRSLRAATA